MSRALRNQGGNPPHSKSSTKFSSFIFTIIFFMATISELENVRRNPIKEGLNAFRDLFQSTCTDLSIASSSDAVQVTGRVYYDVGGFYERYFEGKVWTNNARDIYEESRAQYTEGRWSDWPEPSLQGPFFEWFMKFQDIVLSGLGRRYYTSANKVLRGSEADRKLDIFLTPTGTALPEGEQDWSNVLVIGEYKQNPDEDRSAKTLVQLARYQQALGVSYRAQ